MAHTLSPPRADEVERVANSMDGFYRILGIDLSANASQIKKAYRKRSLRYHPDKVGGDTRAFQYLNRAYAILKDSKRRKMYDILGLDIVEDSDDGVEETRSSDSDESSSTEGEEKLPSMFSKESQAAREFVGWIGLSFLQVMILMLAPQYWLLLYGLCLFLTAGAAYTIWSDPLKNKASLASWAGLVGALFLLRWSTPEGWIFWLCESALLFLSAFGSGEIFGDPALRIGAMARIATGVGSVVLAWWLNGQLRRYLLVLFLVFLAWVGIFFFFLLAGLLVESTIESKLKRCAPKIRGEITRLREECRRLTRRLREYETKMKSGASYEPHSDRREGRI